MNRSMQFALAWRAAGAARRYGRLGRGSSAACLLAAVLLVACGGSKKEAADASGAAQPESGTPWKEKSREQRMDWMAVAVFPKMRALFVEHDAEANADFSCQTCHGEGMEMVDFKMPNDLFALARTNTLAAAREYDERTTKFMLEVVTPEMARLLDMEPYGASNKAGFGCQGCHPVSKD